ncbi:hypothetical protein GCM10007385_29390 [Tateyamaria omphalii]|uniref:hypothetical protein n=1 Tax=Tateyamaria omphalii TaxID=299262 RepID=UPI001676CBCF|nr:hypothetical protein [Tateyamaria omphalii]GGX58720.1 hypothetical protein GCM10007385_29390 [Tateyamaria omphalii]
MKLSTTIIAGAAALGLAACGGGSSYSSARAVPATPVLFATGPIYSACRSGGRDQASRARCGCVQAVANQSLSSSDQSRGAGFFSNPQQAQEVRVSDRASDERFWRRWKDYSDSAARQCT